MQGDWKIYLVVLDGINASPATPPLNFAAFHQYLADSADFGGFWNYIPYTYCIKTRLVTSNLREKLMSFLAPRTFLLVDITASAKDGFMPLDAWQWFTQPPRQHSAVSVDWSKMLGYTPNKA